MKERKVPLNLEYYLILIVILIAGASVVLNALNKDINFCRRVWLGLTRGQSGVENMIDWSSFKAFDDDIGSVYNGLSDDRARERYRKSFIKAFSLGYKMIGLQPSSQFKGLTHWRVYKRNNKGLVIVAVDNPSAKKTILFTISKIDSRNPKLITVSWREGN